MIENLQKLMTETESHEIGVPQLNSEQQEAIFRWGIRMFGLGQHTVGDIQDIKYEGHVIILDDNSRWAVDETDVSTAEFWSTFDKVVVIDGIMYRLDDAEQVTVERES
jgi:hypothetical protein